MVVYIVHTRDRRGYASPMTSRSLVRLASRSAAAIATTMPSSSSANALSLSRAGGCSLRATSPPPSTSVDSTACWESLLPPASVASTVCVDEDWEEVVASGDADASNALQEATEEHGVVFGVVPTDDEVHAAITSIKKVFEKAPVVDSEAVDLQALAWPIAVHPSSRIFVNHFALDRVFEKAPVSSRVFEKAPVVDSEAVDLQALALPIAVHPSSRIFVNHFALDSDASEVGLDEWIEPARLVLNSSALLSKEHQCVLDAFRLLKEEPSVQKMVMALSTDKDVWDVVMNNKVVQEFKRSFQDAKKTNLKGSFTASAPGFMMWVLENTQAKIRELLEKILGLVNMLFQAGDKNYNISDDIVKMSFMLSVFVFIVVIIARIH